jgi:prepilin-type N-terminal cleavage/methylation domain-containing protein
MMQKSQSGRSMIEMLAVLMIIGVLSVGALAGLTQVNRKFNAVKMHNDMHSISAEVVNLYSWQRSYPDSNQAGFQATLCREEVFPDGCDENNVAYNPFGGVYTVTTDTNVNSPTFQTLTITTDNLPESVCKDLEIQEWLYVIGEPECTTGTSFSVTFE